MEVHDELINLMARAIELARDNKQVIGENNDYFLTLFQLEALIKLYDNSQSKS